jgi:hypothetical protein
MFPFLKNLLLLKYILESKDVYSERIVRDFNASHVLKILLDSVMNPGLLATDDILVILHILFISFTTLHANVKYYSLLVKTLMWEA